MVVGYVTYGEPKKYTTYKEWDEDRSKHQIPEGDPTYDMKPGQVKYGYPILSYEAEPNPYRVTERGIVFRDAERSEQKNPFKKKEPAAPITSAAMVAKYDQDFYNKRGWSYAEGGPLTTEEFESWSSNFAEQTGGKRRNPDAVIVSRVGAATTGKDKIVLAKGDIKDPTILKIAVLEDSLYNGARARTIEEVLRNAGEEERERYLADNAGEGLVVLHNPVRYESGGQDARGSGEKQSSHVLGDSELQNGRGSTFRSEEQSEDGVSRLSIQSDASSVYPEGTLEDDVYNFVIDFRCALAMPEPGCETAKKKAPVTDDRGQVLFVEPHSTNWAVARDADGILKNNVPC